MAPDGCMFNLKLVPKNRPGSATGVVETRIAPIGPTAWLATGPGSGTISVSCQSPTARTTWFRFQEPRTTSASPKKRYAFRRPKTCFNCNIFWNRTIPAGLPHRGRPRLHACFHRRRCVESGIGVRSLDSGFASAPLPTPLSIPFPSRPVSLPRTVM